MAIAKIKASTRHLGNDMVELSLPELSDPAKFCRTPGVSSAMLKYFERTDETGRSWLLEHFHDYCRLPGGEDTCQGTAFRGCGKTPRLKLKKMWKSTRIVWHSAASRNAVDASLATHGGSPGLQAGESFLRIGLQSVCEN